MVEFSSSSSSDAEHSRALRRNAKSRARRLRRDQRAIVSLTTTPTTTATLPLHGSRKGPHTHHQSNSSLRFLNPHNDPHRRHDVERSSSEEEEEVLQDTHVSIAGEPVSVMRGTVYCPQRRRCFSIAQVASRPEAFFAMPSDDKERGGYRRARDTRRGGLRGALDVPASAVEVADLLRVGRPVVTLDKARHNGFYMFVRLVVAAPSVQCPIVSDTNAVMTKHEEEEGEEQIPDKVAGAAGLNWQRKLPGRAAVWGCASSSNYLCHNPRLSSSSFHSCSSDPVVIPMQKFGLVPEMALLNYGDPFRHTVLLRDPMEMVTQPFHHHHHHHHTPGTSLWTLQRPSKSCPVGDGGDGGEDGSGVRSDRNDHPIRNAGQAEEEPEEGGRILSSSFSSTRGKGTIYDDCGSRWLLEQESMPLPGPRQPWRWVRSGGGQFAMAVGPGGRWCGWWGPSLRVVETHPGHTFDATQWVHVLPEAPVDRDLFYGVGPAAATVRGLHCAWAVVCEAAEGKKRGKYHQQQQQSTGALRLLRVRGSRGASGEILDAKVPCGPNPTAVGCLLTSGGGDPNAPPNLLVGYQNGQIQFLSAQAPKLRWITPLPTASSSSSLLSRSPVVALRGLTSVGFQSVQMNGEVKLWDIRKLQEPSKVVLQGGGVWGAPAEHPHDERQGVGGGGGGVTTGAATAFAGSYGVVMRRGRATLWEGRSGDILHVWEGEGLVEHAAAVLVEVPSGVVLLSAVKQHSGACTIDTKEWTRF